MGVGFVIVYSKPYLRGGHMSNSSLEDQAAKWVFYLLAFAFAFTVGLLFGGIILGLWALIQGWDESPWWVRYGSVILSLVGVGAVVIFMVDEGIPITALDGLLVLSPFVGLGISSTAYIRREEGSFGIHGVDIIL